MPARKSSTSKRVTGTERKSRTKTPPQPERGAERPDWLSDRAAEWWDVLAPGLTEDGLLTDRSAMQLALACDAMAKIEALSRIITPEYLEEHADAKSYPQALAMHKNVVKIFQEASAKLGLSPSDWQKLDTNPEGPSDDEEGFFTGPRMAS